MKIQDLKPGMLVRVNAGNTTHEGQIGIVREPAPDTGFDNDHWIEFLTAPTGRGPYAPYELEIVTEAELDGMISELEMYRTILRGANKCGGQ